MNRIYDTHYSERLRREMHFLIYGETGVPLIAFPTQDGMCDNWESFQMPEALADYIENGTIQLFCVDTVDRESWSDSSGNKTIRAQVQEAYYHYIVDEAIPRIRSINGTGNLPITAGLSLGATHAAIVFLRRPELFSGMLGCSGPMTRRTSGMTGVIAPCMIILPSTFLRACRRIIHMWRSITTSASLSVSDRAHGKMRAAGLQVC